MTLIFDYWTPPGWGGKVASRARVRGREADYANRHWVYICGLLWSDYQTADACARVLREIASVERGELSEGGWAGNAWRTTVTRGGVQIDHHTNPEWDEQADGHFRLAEFKAAIEGWKHFLEMPASLDSRLEISLPCR